MRVVVAWSGGKDSVMAMHRILSERAHMVMGLLTTFTEGYDRVTMHGVRRSLVRLQAERLGYPLYEVFIPAKCDMETYGKIMSKTMMELKLRGVEGVVFGDIFLEDVRRYREENLSKVGIRPLFPLWGMDAGRLLEEFMELGFRAVVVCVDSRVLGPEFVGRELDKRFLESLPKGVDPCGENGEYHTFVYDGPIFRRRIVFKVGETVLRDGFYYTDLIPA